MTASIEDLRFDEQGLIPAVVQDSDSGLVLMVAFMSRESVETTLATGEVHFWSRSRRKIWRKGETSGNVLRLRSLVADCDLDCLLVRAEPAGPVCHTGERSCFFQMLGGSAPSAELGDALGRLSRIIRERHESLPEGSYTAELLAKGSSGIPRIAQKVGEESTEVVIAATQGNAAEIAEESADLLYHLLVLWRASGIAPEAVASALARRMK
jgi:phosphoribosyl-ATP pyrophosphohydrolase/phosphoribosyl-AMP cyclohydrolase